MDSSNANEIIGSLLGEELAGQKTSNDAFRQTQDSSNSQMQEIIAGILKGQQKKAEPLNPDIQGIVNALSAQPFLIPPVSAYVTKLVSKINEAITDAIKENTPAAADPLEAGQQ